VKDDRVFLRHICDAINRIEDYTARGRATFLSTPLVQDAVIRNLEVIGEAVKNLSRELRTDRPEVAWSRIAGLRDVLIHEYFGVDLEIVWNVVEARLPDLKVAVQSLLAAAPGRDGED